jgi:hypothetical protein
VGNPLETTLKGNRRTLRLPSLVEAATVAV